MKYDVTIIGAGIIGSLLSDNLSKYDLNICLLEKNNDSGLEQSMSSSAIVHSGIDPKDGTLKAKLNKKGNEMMEGICDDLKVKFDKVGGYVCATNSEEEEIIQEKLLQAKKRGIEAKIISKEELLEVEPNLNPDITCALSMPTTAVVYPTEITIAAVERSMLNGVDVKYEYLVLDIKQISDGFEIVTSKSNIKTDFIINCAGIYSDNIAKMITPDLDISITPKRGEYFVTDNKKPIVKSVIYPVPTKNGKGVLAIPTIHKNVLLGPNGVVQDSKEDDSTHTEDLKYVRGNITKLINKFPTDVIKTYAGLRTTGNKGDFYIKYAPNNINVINALCIDSPGIASSPAIVEMIVNMYKDRNDLKLKKTYEKNITPYLDLKRLPLDEQNKLIAKNDKYGKIVCRCEQITEGEIIDSIKKTNGAKDLTGIKFRIRPMLGMCQGGFCETEVVRILSQQLKVDISQISRRGEDTLIVKNRGYND